MATYQPKPSIFPKKVVVQPKDADVIALWENKGRLGLLASLQESIHRQVKK